MLACIYIHHTHTNTNTLLKTRSDQTFQPTVSSSWQNADVTHWDDILQSHQCLPLHSADKAKGKIQSNVVSHKRVGEPWAHAAKGTSSFVHEVSNPVGRNRNRQMCCNQNISPTTLILVSQSMSSCSPLNICCFFGLGPLQIRVGGDTTDVQLVKLLPNTAYSLSLFALHGESASEPLTKQGVTCM